VGRVAKAMGMDVIVHTATEKTTPEQRADHGYFVPGIGDPDGSIPSKWFSGDDKASLHNFLAQDIDILVVSVPLTYAAQRPK
jgi:orotidine-5'-phosphate decarboxylase